MLTKLQISLAPRSPHNKCQILTTGNTQVLTDYDEGAQKLYILKFFVYTINIHNGLIR